VPDFGALPMKWRAAYDEIAFDCRAGPCPVKVILGTGRLGREALQLLVEARSTPAPLSSRPQLVPGRPPPPECRSVSCGNWRGGVRSKARGNHHPGAQAFAWSKREPTRLGTQRRGGPDGGPAPSTLHWSASSIPSTSPRAGMGRRESRTGGLRAWLQIRPLWKRTIAYSPAQRWRRPDCGWRARAPQSPAAAWRRLCVVTAAVGSEVGAAACDGFVSSRSAQLQPSCPKAEIPGGPQASVPSSACQLVPQCEWGGPGSSTNCLIAVGPWSRLGPKEHQPQLEALAIAVQAACTCSPSAATACAPSCAPQRPCRLEPPRGNWTGAGKPAWPSLGLLIGAEAGAVLVL